MKFWGLAVGVGRQAHSLMPWRLTWPASDGSVPSQSGSARLCVTQCVCVWLCVCQWPVVRRRRCSKQSPCTAKCACECRATPSWWNWRGWPSDEPPERAFDETHGRHSIQSQLVAVPRQAGWGPNLGHTHTPHARSCSGWLALALSIRALACALRRLSASKCHAHTGFNKLGRRGPWSWPRHFLKSINE